MAVEFKKGAFSFLLAGLENNCTIYQRLRENVWVERRRNAVSDGRTIKFVNAAWRTAPGHVTQKTKSQSG